MSLNRMIPIQFNRRALRKDDGCVQQTCSGIESDEGPQEYLPRFARKATDRPLSAIDLYAPVLLCFFGVDLMMTGPGSEEGSRTYNNLFKKRLMDILSHTVERMRMNSQIRSNMMPWAARALSR